MKKELLSVKSGRNHSCEKMKISLILIIFLHICSARAKVSDESCDIRCRASNNTDNYHKHLHSNSIIYGLANIAADIVFDSGRCRDDLMLIKEGIRRKFVWAFKRKYSNANTTVAFKLSAQHVATCGF